MRKVLVILSLALLAGTLAVSCGGRVCNAGDSRACACTADQIGNQVCTVDGSDYEACVCMTECQLYAAALTTCYDGLCDSAAACPQCVYYQSLQTAPDGEPTEFGEQAECQKSLEAFNCADARYAVIACLK